MCAKFNLYNHESLCDLFVLSGPSVALIQPGKCLPFKAICIALTERGEIKSATKHFVSRWMEQQAPPEALDL